MNIPVPQVLNLTGNLSLNWKKFKRRWDNYEIASKLKEQSKEVRTATLLTCIGTDAVDIYDGLSFTSEEEKRDIDIVLQKLEAFCVGETNETYERYCFNKRDQVPDETFDAFLANLRTLAKSCNFGVLEDSLLRDRIVCGILDNDLRRRLLQHSDLSLNSCISKCRAAESTQMHLKAMISPDNVNAMKREQQKTTSVDKRMGTSGMDRPKSSRLRECKFCGRKHIFGREHCPAWGKVCSYCKKKNHFSARCPRKQSIKTLRYDNFVVDEMTRDHEQQSVLTCESVDVADGSRPKKLFVHLQICGHELRFQIDCGATVNVLSVNDYCNICGDAKLQKLRPALTKLVMYNKSETVPLGKVKLPIFNPKTGLSYGLDFMIVKESCAPLLGCPSIQEMNLITVNYENILGVNPETKEFERFSKMSWNDIKHEYTDVFTGLGKFQGKLKLEIDESVPPVQMPTRKIPIAIQKNVKAELDRLENIGVIKRVDCHTPWISNLLITVKGSGKMRVCLDPKPLNKALKRNHYTLPTIENVLPKLNNAKIFTMADVKDGFWHVELEEQSSFFTTFGTPWGRYRWLRMPFGISPAPEEFKRRLDIALEGLNGVETVADDILVCGYGDDLKAATLNSKRNLYDLLQRCRIKGIKLNEAKLKYLKTEVKYLGHVIGKDGLKPDPEKLEGIRKMPSPVDKQGVQRILATANYLQRFAPKLSEITAPMRALLLKESEFSWDEQIHGKCFAEIKRVLMESPVLKYFDDKASTVLQCDASSTGLGACLMQNDHPVAYSSRALTKTECNYAQIEKELLAIVFGMEKFEHYVYGRHVTVESDHKPLEIITKKSLVNAPKRLQRMLLRLQKYDFDVMYKKGQKMFIADALSRAYVNCNPSLPGKSDIFQAETTFMQEIEEIDMLKSVPVTNKTLDILRTATETDSTMQTLKAIIELGWPDTKRRIPVSVHDYFDFKEEMTVQNGILLKGDRIVVPESAKAYILQRAHNSHIGIQGCLRRAREAVFWPKMSQDIEQYVSKCKTCRLYQPQQTKEPMMSSQIPERPWEIIAADLFEFKGRHYLVTVDYYSNFCEVDRLCSTYSSDVIKILKQHMSRHGIPDKLVTDNGPQFNCAEFRRFANNFEFEHVTSSPRYPQSNGKAENAVKTVKRIMMKAVESGSDIYLALLDWRNTPSEGIPGSPAQRLFGRRTKTLLPMSQTLLQPKLVTNVNRHLQHRKFVQARYYNMRAKELDRLYPGQLVRLKPDSNHKTWRRAKVESQVNMRSYRVRTEDGAVYRRNRRHLRCSREPDDFKPCHLPVDFECDSESPDSVPSKSLDARTDNEHKSLSPNKLSSPIKTPTVEPLALRRSKRTVRKPLYLRDYVT